MHWLQHLWREWTVESWRDITPAFARPSPESWRETDITCAWLGHATVLINFYGVRIITDPALFPRIGIRLPGLTIGPKRLTQPALTFAELPPIDLVLLSHAHFDHFDLRTLGQFGSATRVVAATRTSDLLRGTRLRYVTELRWGESTTVGALKVTAIPVKHWGARMQRDMYRGYNGYLLEQHDRRVLFTGDTAYTEKFAELCTPDGIDLGIVPIAAYDPWIRSHCTPEQALAMMDMAGVRYIVPVHHQTFRLSAEPPREPIERFTGALSDAPERIAVREIGETFVLP